MREWLDRHYTAIGWAVIVGVIVLYTVVTTR